MSIVERALLRLLEEQCPATEDARQESAAPSNDSPQAPGTENVEAAEARRRLTKHDAHPARDRSNHIAMPADPNSPGSDQHEGAVDSRSAQHGPRRYADEPRDGDRVGQRHSMQRSAGDTAAPTGNASSDKPVFSPANLRFDAAHDSTARPTGYRITRKSKSDTSGDSEIVDQVRQPAADASVLSAKDVIVETAGSRSPSAANPTTALKPSFEVDRFAWPEITNLLLETRDDQFGKAVRHLAGTAAPDSNFVAVTRMNDTKGSTTLTICLARAIAALDKSVLVVDANLQNPALAETLQVANAYGWNSDFEVTEKIADALITSLEDQIVIAPWSQRDEPLATEDHRAFWKTFANSVRSHFDVVLVDTAPLADGESGLPLDRELADLVILLQGTGPHADQQIEAPVRQLLSAGLTPVGIIRNDHLSCDQAQT